MLSRKATASKVLAISAAVALAAAACSSNSNGGKSNSSSSGGTTASGTNTAACNAAKPFLSPPKTIPLNTPLSAKPPTGKTVVVTQNPEAVTLETNKGFTQAAHMLGWTVKYVNVNTTATGPQQAFTSALQLHPDAILVSGNPVSTFSSQLATAKSEHIPVLMNDNGSPAPGYYPSQSLYEIGLDSDAQTGLWGKMTADYAACHGAKSVLVVDLPLYPILHAYSEGVVTELHKIAPKVNAQILTAQITDLSSGDIPSKVVAAIQKNPSINWVLFCLGDMTTGLYASLRSAGLSGKVSIGGESASAANIQELKAKQDAVWTGFADVIHGFYRADALARIFTHESLAPDDTSQLPTQLLTQQNVSSAPLDPSGYYEAYANYASYFAKLWKLKS